MKPTPSMTIVLAIAMGLVAGMGCGKKAETTAPAASKATSTAPAPASAAAPAKPAAAGDVTAETTAKLAAAEWAIKQDQIKNDPDGQWAVSATASSTYEDAKEQERWAANQVTGVPNVEAFGDDGNAWAPKTEEGGIEWLDIQFAKPVYASEVRVRESCGSGAIIRIDLFDEQGTAHQIWAGADPTTTLNYLLVKVPKPSYKTGRVKITLATNVVPGWNEIDAVQLVGKSTPEN